MDMARRKVGVKLILALAVLLLTAPGSALVHAYKHDAGSPQGQVCTGCAAASQLDSGCVDDTEMTDVRAGNRHLQALQTEAFAFQHKVAVRQRGPPIPA